MAHVETWYRCPTCDSVWSTFKEAEKCKNSHNVRSEQWAVGAGGKAVRINEHCSVNSMYGLNWALEEANLSDNIHERKKQLEKKKKLEEKSDGRI
jgi:hypothetical protein